MSQRYATNVPQVEETDGHRVSSLCCIHRSKVFTMLNFHRLFGRCHRRRSSDGVVVRGPLLPRLARYHGEMASRWPGSLHLESPNFNTRGTCIKKQYLRKKSRVVRRPPHHQATSSARPAQHRAASSTARINVEREVVKSTKPKQLHSDTLFTPTVSLKPVDCHGGGEMPCDPRRGSFRSESGLGEAKNRARLVA